MIVYSNSCSFGEAGQGHAVYSDLVAKNYNAACINNGLSSSCNRRIIRTAIRDLIKLKEQDTVIALIGLTFISRTELWQPWLPAADNDGHFYSVEIDHKTIDWSIKGLIDTIVPDIHQLADRRVQDYYKQWLDHYHPESAVTDLLTDVIMFAGWCQSNNVKYCIFSNVDMLPSDAVVGYTSPFISTLKTQVLQDPNIINPWQFSFGTYALENGFRPKDYHLYKEHGHPGEDAHKFFSQYLIEHLNKQYD
jgi:hypothetical protein